MFYTHLRPSLSLPGPSDLTRHVVKTISTTPILYASRERRLLAKRKKQKNLSLRASSVEKTTINPVLGLVIPTDQSGSPLPRPDPFPNSRLGKLLLSPEQVWNSPSIPLPFATSSDLSDPSITSTPSTSSIVPTSPEATEDETTTTTQTTTTPAQSTTTTIHDQRPNLVLPGIGKEDLDILFGALPRVTAELLARKGDEDPEEIVRNQEMNVGMISRVLDLRNASKRGIEVVNRQRIVDDFGKDGGCGGSRVQAALLTHQIRVLSNHLSTNPRDKSNRRSLRSLVHKRQQVLKYFKRRDPDEYPLLLNDLGLEEKAVEGELIVR
ncbi:hypothetical protein TREMEDRAFT_73621 [Tremella mesenterica DSM 1558]|uniref:uncharacterized protein n=1 Tax=Tremella mesenterica (strain ATCC 24925 / CBS 8224 / DSM 1558 / NBRC 9311 / NRRL Y-6157 / RJB 2259-6 / UBC 559-6) TaxID=578456 RepID=UPI0003F4939F|nr:uncharacterized protein TREMEDRAFT_73621 [Tremella mesenterica DSM 1558]EIW69800.1 hypothetical protein TREMEDRAFT_73621 [Tremella mesenterica DSM 1558]